MGTNDAKQLKVPDDLHRRIKAHTAIRGEQIQDFVVRALEKALTEEKDTIRRRSGVIDLH